MFRAKTGTILVILVSILLGALLAKDPQINVRIKMLHYMLKVNTEVTLLLGQNPFWMDKLAPLVAAGEGKDGVDSVDLVVPPLQESVFPGITPLQDVNVRVFYPHGAIEKKLPVIVYYHGGGLCLGSHQNPVTEELVRPWVQNEGVIVVAVGYRLAPEFTLPAPIDDSVAALLWVHAAEHPLLQKFADTNKIVVLGDSAGGYLAAVTCQVVQARYPAVKVAHQVLVYPSLHFHDTASREQFKEGYILFRSFTKAFEKAFLPDNRDFLTSPLNLPLRATSFSNLPSAQVVVAELDMLRDESLLYANALKQAGVDVKINFVHGAVHGFFTFAFLPESHKASDDIFKHLKEKVF